MLLKSYDLFPEVGEEVLIIKYSFSFFFYFSFVFLSAYNPSQQKPKFESEQPLSILWFHPQSPRGGIVRCFVG